jgi:hypothetical protein
MHTAATCATTDLVLRALNSAGEPVVVCVEAKAGEPLGATVVEQAAAAKKAAKKAKEANKSSNASARLSDLVGSLCGCSADDPRVAKLRYQLLTAWAGTLAEADGAAHAVMAVHEFRTDERPDDKSALNGEEISRFGAVVLGCDLPGHGQAPWCARVSTKADTSPALYFAHTVTDLRTEKIVSHLA